MLYFRYTLRRYKSRDFITREALHGSIFGWYMWKFALDVGTNLAR